jgi:hypothetical protein
MVDNAWNIPIQISNSSLTDTDIQRGIIQRLYITLEGLKKRELQSNAVTQKLRSELSKAEE